MCAKTVPRLKDFKVVLSPNISLEFFDIYLDIEPVINNLRTGGKWGKTILFGRGNAVKGGTLSNRNRGPQ